MAEWIGAHRQNFSHGRAGFRPEAIVIHIMDGSLVGTDSWFNDPRSCVSAHYGIGKAGQVHHYVKESDSAHHAGVVVAPRWPLIKRRSGGSGFINPNFYTVGIEHEGRGLDPGSWPKKMFDASVALTADIARRWSISVDERHIIPHCDIRQSKPDCPGRGVRLAAYIEAVRNAQGAPAPAPAERAVNLSVRLLRTANIRPRPDTQNVPGRTALRGDRFEAVVVTSGEVVGGNGNWFRNNGGEYLWAGNTDHPDP